MLKLPNCLVCSIVTSFTVLGLFTTGQANITAVTSTGAYVRVQISPGQYQNEIISVSVAATSYTLTDGRQGCDPGVKYDYSTVTTAPSYPVTINGVTYAATDAERFWDFIYDGFSGGGACDWSANCHGYAFGVGDWPKGPEGPAKIIAEGTGDCWVEDGSNATIAVHSGHTVKITMQDCQNSIGLIVKTSAEKWKESGVYTKSGNCTDGSVDLGAGGADVMLGVQRGGLTFKLYKRS